MTLSNQPYSARRILLDSSGFLSLVNPHDEHHAAALSTWTRLSQEQWSAFTTNFIVAETHALFIIRLGHGHAREFLRSIVHSATTILRVSPADEEQGRVIVLQHDDKDYSLTDAISFTIMERLRIPYVFTFDRHFTQFGLTALPGS